MNTNSSQPSDVNGGKKSLIINSFDKALGTNNANSRYLLRDNIQGNVKLEFVTLWNTFNSVDVTGSDIWIELQVLALSPTLYKVPLSSYPIYYPRNVGFTAFLQLIQDWLNSIIPGWPPGGFVVGFNNLNYTVSISNFSGLPIDYIGDTTTPIPNQDKQLMSYYLGFPVGTGGPMIIGQIIGSLQLTYFLGPTLTLNIVIKQFDSANSSDNNTAITFSIVNTAAPGNQIVFESFQYSNESYCDKFVNALDIEFRDAKTNAVLNNLSNWVMKLTYTPTKQTSY